MSSLFVRTYTFTDGTTAYGSQVETEIGNIVTVLNNLNTASSNWGRVASLNAVAVPLIADCSSGSQDIAEFKNNNVIKVAVGSTGAITAQDAITLTPTSNQIVLGTTRTITLSAGTPATSSRVVTVPDPGANANFVLSEAAATINGVKTFAGQLIGKGTITNDSAATGNIGEVQRNYSASTASPGNGQWFDVTSISLTAGDWDVTGQINFNLSGGTATQMNGGISITTGNASTGLTLGDNWLQTSVPTAVFDTNVCVSNYRLSLASTTTVYLKANIAFSAGTPVSYGRISARRIR